MDLVQVAGTLAALSAGVAAVGYLGRGALQTGRRIGHMVDDVLGQPARPGHPAQPGIIEQLAAIRAELHPNHGGSLRDAVDRVEQGLAEHLADHHADR